MDIQMYRNDLSKFLGEVKNYIKRQKENTLLQNDRQLMLDLLEEYYVIFNDHSKQDINDEIETEIDQIVGNLLVFEEGVKMNDVQGIEAIYNELNKISEQHKLLQKRLDTAMGVFKSDAAVMQLHEEKLKMMQELINLDIKIYGKVSEKTLEVLEVQHCEIGNNNKVQEKNGQETVKELSAHEKNSGRENMDVADNAGKVLKLKLPKMDPGQKNKVENMLFQSGARYRKYTIPAEKKCYTYGNLR